MYEIRRLLSFAARCFEAARTISLAADAARLRQMAEEALAQAVHLESGLQRQGQQQQQQQPQPDSAPSKDEEDEAK
jgi:hypothetical protein